MNPGMDYLIHNCESEQLLMKLKTAAATLITIFSLDCLGYRELIIGDGSLLRLLLGPQLLETGDLRFTIGEAAERTL